jgi:hypothetical protein
VRRNAVRHGLAADLVAQNPEAAADGERIAASLGGRQDDYCERGEARIIAEAQVTLKRIRTMRTNILDAALTVSSLEQLLRLERYEERALSRRKRAVRALLET